jgi:hypothetical protein
MNATAARPARRYLCNCQHAFQFFGGGRHRRFYELDDLRWERPLIARLCPSCQHRLPITRGPLALVGDSAQHGEDFTRPSSTRPEIQP